LGALLALTSLVAATATAGAAAAFPEPHVDLDRLLGPVPSLAGTRKRPLSEPTRVLASDGTLIGIFRPEEKFTPVAPDAIPATAAAVIVASEDRGFWTHRGFDVEAMLRALGTNARAGGRIRQGGSTITQQLAKNLVTDGAQTLDRKVAELKAAIQLERHNSKPEILAAYLNSTYFGEGAIGVEAAARTYFRKPAEDLSLSESALLAGIIPAPSTYDPRVNPEVADRRRLTVLDRVQAAGIVPQPEVQAARDDAPIVAPPVEPAASAPFFLDYVRRWLLEDHRMAPSAIFGGGLTIRTTLDLHTQGAARLAVASHLPRADDPEAAVAVVEPSSGAVRALVGGRDWSRSEVNLALGRLGGGSGRQPGSAFKAFVLAAAYEAGMSPADLLPAPAEVELPGGHVVHNYARHGYPPMALSEATARSINTTFVQLGRLLGPRRVAALARDLGLTSIPADVGPSVAIGAYEVSPLNMAAAYASFAVDGLRVAPHPVESIRDASGSEVPVPDARDAPARVLSADTARLVTATLTGVVAHGTGTAARFDAPIAGKTGTSNDDSNAWFVGYTPVLATAVWVGYPRGNVPMHDIEGVRNVTGGSIPARIWHDLMNAVTEDRESLAFPPPPGRPAARVNGG
jgi:penicillin-binding protein 1A